MDYKNTINTVTQKVKCVMVKKRNIAIICGVVIICLILIVSCANILSSSPQKAVRNMFDTYKNAEVFAQTDIDPELISVFTDNFNYDIISISENGDSAVVTTEITALNARNAVTELMTEMLGSGEVTEYDDDEICEVLLETLKKEKETVTTTVDIALTKDNGRWYAKAGDAVTDAILGGMNTALENME